MNSQVKSQPAIDAEKTQRQNCIQLFPLCASPRSLPLCDYWRSRVLANSTVLLILTALVARAGEGSLFLPYQTGSHLQMVREFFTTSNGLPANEIRAVTVTREGAVLVAGGRSLARLE